MWKPTAWNSVSKGNELLWSLDLSHTPFKVLADELYIKRFTSNYWYWTLHRHFIQASPVSFTSFCTSLVVDFGVCRHVSDTYSLALYPVWKFILRSARFLQLQLSFIGNKFLSRMFNTSATLTLLTLQVICNSSQFWNGWAPQTKYMNKDYMSRNIHTKIRI